MKEWQLWIKGTIALALLGALFAFGIWVGATREIAKNLANESAHAAAIEKKEAERRKAVEDLEATQLAKASERDAALEAQRATLIEEGKTRERAIRAYYKNLPAVVIDPGAVRLWREGNGETGGSGEHAPSPPPTESRADATASGCTLADLHANHEALIQEYKDLARRHRGLQSWSNDALATCNAELPN